MSQHFDKPRLRSIILYYLNHFCDMEQMVLSGDASKTTIMSMPETFNKNFKVFITEIIPQILISDGHNFIEAVFSKESINEFRKYFSHVKFSNLRDKVIQIGKWSLQVDHVNSKQVYNSHQNINIKLIIESFKPQINSGDISQRLTLKATSLFKNEEVKAHIQNFRHWYAMTCIKKEAFSVHSIQFENSGQIGNVQQIGEQSLNNSMVLPDLKDVLCLNKQGQSEGQKSTSLRNKSKKSLQNEPNHNSQNTTQLSEKSDKADISSQDISNFGGNIQNSQIFRIGIHEYDNLTNVKVDSFEDLKNFKKQVEYLKKIQTKDIRITDLERIVIQEKGEQFYHEKKFSKSRQWLDLVQDEFRREELKMKLEYFNVGPQNDTYDYTKETLWQRGEREKQSKRQHIGQSLKSRRITGYTFNNPPNVIREKLIKILDQNKTSEQLEAEKQLKSMTPQKQGRPRANSQENILIQVSAEDSKKELDDKQMFMNIGNRETLSQFVTCRNPVAFNDDTQSEDSMEAEVNLQTNKERQRKKAKKDDMELDSILNSMQPMGISMFRSYLEWFQKKDLDSPNHQEHLEQEMIQRQRLQESQEKIKKEQLRTVIAGRTRSSMPSGDKQLSQRPIINENSESADSQDEQTEGVDKMEIISKPPQINDPIDEPENAFQDTNMDHNNISQVKDEEMEDEEIHDQGQIQVKQEPETFKQPLRDPQEQPRVDQQMNPFKYPSPEKSEDQLDLSSPQFDTEEKQMIDLQAAKNDEHMTSDEVPTIPQVQLMQDSSKSPPKAETKSPPKQYSLENKPNSSTSPLKFEPVIKPFDSSPCKDLLNPTPLLEPPKPLEEMTDGEKAMWQIQLQYHEMQQQMLEQQRKMHEHFLQQQEEITRKIREEEERKRLRELSEREQKLMAIEDQRMKQFLREEKERLAEEERIRKEAEIRRQKAIEEENRRKEQERLRLEQERLERERLERERLELERLERERLERQKLEREMLERQKLEREMLERQKLEREMLERERLERERLEREMLERERLERERLERERLEQEKLEKERREQEKLERERREQERLELERKERLRQEELRRQEEERRLREIELKRAELERQKQELMRVQQAAEMERIKKEQANEHQRQEQMIFERERKSAELQALELEKQRRMQQLMEEETQKQKQIELQKLKEKQRSQLLEDDLSWEEDQQKPEQLEGKQDQEMTLEEASHSDLEEEDHQLLEAKRQDYVERMNKKFEPALNKKIREMETKDMTRRQIKCDENQDKLFDFLKIKSIKTEKFESQRKQLLQENSSSQPSNDSKEKIQGEKQAPQQSLKQAMKTEMDQDVQSSSKVSEADNQGAQDQNLEQFDLFHNRDQNQNQQQDLSQTNQPAPILELNDDNLNDLEDITPTQLMNEPNNVNQGPSTPPQSKQIKTYSDGEAVNLQSQRQNNTAAQTDIETLKQQLAKMNEMLQQANKVITQLSSQTQFKQQNPVQDSGQVPPQDQQAARDQELYQASETEKDSEEEYHLPAFGSQVQQQPGKPRSTSPKKKSQVSQFSLSDQQMAGQKRNYEQYQEGQDKIEGNGNQNEPPRGSPQKGLAPEIKNLQDFVLNQQLNNRKNELKKEFKTKQREQFQQRQQMRMQGSHSQRPSSMDRSMQRAPQMQQRRVSSQSRDRVIDNSQTNRMPPQMQSRPNGLHQPQMGKIQGHSQAQPGYKNGNPSQRPMNNMVQQSQMRNSQQQRLPVRHSARGPGPQPQSPRKQALLHQNQSNFGGGKRIVHMQQPSYPIHSKNTLEEHTNPAIQNQKFQNQIESLKRQQDQGEQPQKKRRLVSEDIL